MPTLSSQTRFNLGVFAVLLLYTTGPILSALAAGLIAKMLGCTLNEAGHHPCECLGVDLGDTLYAMFVMSWFALVTLPTGLLALFAFSVYSIVQTIVSRSDRKWKKSQRPRANRKQRADHRHSG